MLIPELYTSHLAVSPQSGSAGTRAWTTGQILDATVVRQSADGAVTLRVGGHEIQAQTGLKLAAEQSVTLQVAQAGSQLVLRIMHAGNATHIAQPTTTPGLPKTEATLAQAWRQVLPREGNLQPLLGQLNAANLAAPDTSSPLPAVLAAALRQLTARLPALETLANAGGLRQAMRDSGLFLESSLAQAAQQGKPVSLASDFKAGLLTLISQLQTQPASAGAAASQTPASLPATSLPAEPIVPALLRQADAALARVEQNQLTALSGRTDGSVPLIIELPVRDGDNFRMLRLQIEPDDSACAAAGQPTPWSITLDLDLGTLGPLQARVVLNGDSVSATFSTAQPGTAGLIQQHLGDLGQSLQRAGLTPTALTCQAGSSPPAGTDRPPTTTVLDERA